jgi:hypothetical protein
MTSPAPTSCPSSPYPLCVWGRGVWAQGAAEGAQVRLLLSALGDGGTKGTVGTGAPSQRRHQSGIWLAPEVHIGWYGCGWCVSAGLPAVRALICI